MLLKVAFKHLKIWSIENKPLVKKILDKIKRQLETRGECCQKSKTWGTSSTKSALKEKQILSGKLTLPIKKSGWKRIVFGGRDSAGGTAKR